MKKILILTGALLSLTVGIASASSGVVNLTYNDCGGPTLVTFACNTNTGNRGLVGTYTSFVDLVALNGNEIVIDMQTSGATMSPWWQVRNYTDGTVACRGGTTPAASMSFDFTASSNCFDYWGGQASGGFGILREYGGTNRQRILGVCAVGLSSAGPLAANQETYSFRLTINNSKTVGTGACAGCADGALIVLNSILCTQNPETSQGEGGGNRINADEKMETLGTFASFQNILPGAPGPTPTKNTTWGAVKSLYR